MPNNQLSEVQTGFLKPIAPVQDTSTAQAIQSFGNLAIEGVKMKTTADLRQDVMELEQQYLNDNASTLTTEEALATKDFGTRINRLKRISSATGRTSDFRIRAEALLKERINAYPGLAPELRRTVSSVLGFDPTGESIAQREASLKSEAKTAQQKLDAIDRDAVSLNMSPGDVFTEEGQRLYLTLKQQERNYHDLQIKAGTKKLTKELNAEVDYAMSVSDAEKYADNLSVSIDNDITQFLVALPDVNVTKEQLEKGLTPEVYDKLGEENLFQLSNMLEAERDVEVSKITALYADMPETVIKSVGQLISTPYDKILRSISLKESTERAKQDSVMKTQFNIGKLEKYPEWGLMSAIGEISNAVIPDKLVATVVAGEVSQFTKDTLDVKKDEAVQVENVKVDEINGLFEYMNNMFKAEIKDPTLKKANFEQVVGAFEKMVTGLREGKPRGDAADAWMDILANPENKEFIDKVKTENPFIAKEINITIASHGQRIIKSADKRIREFIEETSQNVTPLMERKLFSSTGEAYKPIVKVSVDDLGVIDIEPDVTAINDIDPSLLEPRRIRSGTRESSLTRKIKDIRKTVIKNLNKTVSAFANQSGMSRKDAANKVLANTVFGEAE